MTEEQAPARMLATAEHMPAGLPRYEALERAARGADAARDVRLGLRVRLAMIRLCHELRRSDLMLAPFAWAVAAERREPAAFDAAALHQLRWMHKWVVNGLIGDPRFSLDQVRAALDELAARFQREGASPQPVLGLRVRLADQRGHAEAEELFPAWLGAPGDQLSDCAACVVGAQVEFLVGHGRFAEALAHADPVLRQESACSMQPAGVLSSLLGAFLRAGEPARARQAHLMAYRRLRDRPGDGAALAANLEFLAVTGNAERGLELVERHASLLTELPNPLARLGFLGAVALVLDRIDPARPVSAGPRRVTAGVLRAELVAEAGGLAEAFDRRNGAVWLMRRLAEFLEQPDGPRVTLALPPAEVAEPVVPPEDPRTVAAAAVDAFDAGDFVTGHRLLTSLPRAVELPGVLALRVRARRMFETRPQPTEARTVFAEAVDAFAKLGEHELAVRHRCGLAMLELRAHADHRAGAVAEQAVRDAVLLGDPELEVGARLVLAEVCQERGLSEPAAAQLDAARDLVTGRARRLATRLAVREAEQFMLAGDQRAALDALTTTLTIDSAPADRFSALVARARLCKDLGEHEDTVTAYGELAAFATAADGPWTAEALLEQAAMLVELDLEVDRLPDLVDAVAACRRHLGATATAQACFLLSGAYLELDRYVEAAETLEEALRLVEGKDQRSTELPVRHRLGAVCGVLGEHEAAEEHLLAALDLVPPENRLHRAQVLANLAAAYTNLERVEPTRAAYWESAEILCTAGRAEPAARMLLRLANSIGAQDQEAALAALTRATELAVDADEELNAELIAGRAFVLALHGRYAESLTDNAEAERLAVRLGDVLWQVYLVNRAAQIHLLQGDPRLSESEARRAAALLPEDAPHADVAGVLKALSDALTEQHRTVERDPLAQELLSRL
ncbi:MULTISPECIES: hypothetical protein [unclassified Crossiella]|uniref:hypothetical protein n=1 Tax=unclassified Crossiella TaxID=2620835 RepID=UPI001FFF5165|nr:MULTISPECIES: hypothetical protein [unclassified Crossiella]MCK2240723.1 hypothetical protein [Crossiella sp. S99.2]MCK2252826.1 hypothetical protein [Crossiella sp. S99.1]